MKVFKLSSMNWLPAMVIVGLLAVVGCRYAGSQHADRDAALDGYLILGEVRRAGPVRPADSPKTLLYLIDHAGGFTENAYRTGVEVIHFGKTNKYNCKMIRRQAQPDPVIPLGAIIVVPGTI